MKFEWEELEHSDNPLMTNGTCRAKVLGGWLITHFIIYKENAPSESMTFVSDPNHAWEIE